MCIRGVLLVRSELESASNQPTHTHISGYTPSMGHTSASNVATHGKLMVHMGLCGRV